MKQKQKKLIVALLCGMAGTLCFGAGDWLMIYGEATYHGNIYWLTEGINQIAPWRNALAMFLAFPGIVFYAIGLFAMEAYIMKEKQRRVYHVLTITGLTPWLCLHLFYIMIFYACFWLNYNGYGEAALPLAEAMCGHLSWLVLLSEAIMLPPYLYWFYLVFRKHTVFQRKASIVNPLTFYVLLHLVKSILPDSPFRIGFTNGLMSESMLLWFGVILCLTAKSLKDVKE